MIIIVWLAIALVFSGLHYANPALPRGRWVIALPFIILGTVASLAAMLLFRISDALEG